MRNFEILRPLDVYTSSEYDVRPDNKTPGLMPPGKPDAPDAEADTSAQQVFAHSFPNDVALLCLTNWSEA
jgi:hypothetical protein